jgi:hypothetical protein
MKDDSADACRPTALAADAARCDREAARLKRERYTDNGRS